MQILCVLYQRNVLEISSAVSYITHLKSCNILFIFDLYSFLAQSFEIIFYAQPQRESFCTVVASLIIFGTKTQQWISSESTTWSKQRAVRIFKACTIRQFFSSIRSRSSITKLALPSTNFFRWTTWSCEWAVRIYLTTKQTIELSSWVSE